MATPKLSFKHFLLTDGKSSHYNYTNRHCLQEKFQIYYNLFTKSTYYYPLVASGLSLLHFSNFFWRKRENNNSDDTLNDVKMTTYTHTEETVWQTQRYKQTKIYLRVLHELADTQKKYFFSSFLFDDQSPSTTASVFK